MLGASTILFPSNPYIEYNIRPSFMLIISTPSLGLRVRMFFDFRQQGMQ